MKNELRHYGVLGMRWGVRHPRDRVQKLYRKADRDLQKNYSKLYTKAHNEAVAQMHNGEIDKFNRRQQRKYGEHFAKRPGYVEDYEKVFNSVLDKCMQQSVDEFLSTNRKYIEAQTLEKIYNR